MSGKRVIYCLLGSVLSVLPATVSLGRVAAPLSAISASPSATDKPDPDVLLSEVYKDLAGNHLRTALAKVEALVEAYPTFRLGQLMRGDLLLMQTHAVASLGPVGAPEEKIKNLRDEAIVRLKSLRNRPDPDLVPRAILQLREDQKYVLMVDAKRSRLYVYENIAGQLKLTTDYYVSQGKLGTNKFKAGDQKTPIGVYYITSHLPGKRLPDFYGVGALPINYPNDWDRLNGRSGSGIWLHGTPSDSYSRPPLSSDGCVVLTNPDLIKLFASVDIGKTPVVIADSIEFVNKTRAISDRATAAKLVDDWRRDVESQDPKRVLNNYSGQFKTERGEDRNAWIARVTPAGFGAAKGVSITLHDVTLFLYPGRDDLIVGTFTEEAVQGKLRNLIRKRQYWAREGTQWKIISETVL